jgi:hypothetical protein
MFRHLHRPIAALLLLAYLVSGTSVVPGLIAAAAAIDGSHNVMVGKSSDGISLTLRHRSGDFTPGINDHSSPLARAVVAMTKSSNTGDHTLLTQQMEDSLLPLQSHDITKVATTALNEVATLLHLMALITWKIDSLPELELPLPLSPASIVEQLTKVQMLV